MNSVKESIATVFEHTGLVAGFTMLACIGWYLYDFNERHQRLNHNAQPAYHINEAKKINAQPVMPKNFNKPTRQNQ